MTDGARKWKLSELEYVWGMRQRGVTCLEIGLKLGRSAAAVQGAWRRMGKTGPVINETKPVRRRKYKCSICAGAVTRHNRSGVCEPCQVGAMLYECAECAKKINHKRHSNTGLCLKCYDKRKSRLQRERAAGRPVPPMSRKDQNARACEASAEKNYWPMGKPRGRVAIPANEIAGAPWRCPISKHAAKTMRWFSTPESAMYAAMILANVPLGNPADGRVTPSHSSLSDSPPAAAGGVFRGARHG